MRSIAVVVVGVLALWARGAHAQAKLVPTDIKGAEVSDVEGWSPFLAVTGTVSLTSNSSVVGQVEGFSTLFGIGLTGGTDYVDGRHLLRSVLSLSEGFARTPVVDEFIKTNDVLKLEGQYNYFLNKDLGGYGRLGIQTSMFSAEDVRGVPTTWVEKLPGDAVVVRTSDGFRQRLAGALNPFTINESAGGFAEPIRKEKLNLSVRLGVAGRHTFADNVLLIDDAKPTPEVELLRLADVHQLGLEAFGGATGKLNGGKASYRAGLSVLLPAVNNDSAGRNAGALTRIAAEGALTFNVFSWMSVVYNLSIIRDPQLFPRGEEKVQVQNTALLTFQFALVKKREKPAEPTKEQQELADARARADAAEKRATDAEQRADAAEKRATEAEQNLKDAQPAPAPGNP